MFVVFGCTKLTGEEHEPCNCCTARYNVQMLTNLVLAISASHISTLSRFRCLGMLADALDCHVGGSRVQLLMAQLVT